MENDARVLLHLLTQRKTNVGMISDIKKRNENKQ